MSSRSSGLELCGVPDAASVGVARGPFGHQVAAVEAAAGELPAYSGSTVGGRQELPASAAQRHFDAIARPRIRRIAARCRGSPGPRAAAGRSDVALPVPLGRPGVQRRAGRGVGQPRGGDDAGGQARWIPPVRTSTAAHGPARPRSRRAGPRLADAQHADAGLHPRGHRRHGAGRVRRLAVGVVGLGEGRVREALERQQVFFARLAAPLAFEDPRAATVVRLMPSPTNRTRLRAGSRPGVALRGGLGAPAEPAGGRVRERRRWRQRRAAAGRARLRRAAAARRQGRGEGKEDCVFHGCSGRPSSITGLSCSQMKAARRPPVPLCLGHALSRLAIAPSP